MPSPISPRVLKGGIVTLDPDTGIPLGSIVLQYNPDTLTRRLQPQAIADPVDRTEILRLKGPPVETISVAAEIDATDQLAAPADNPVTVVSGIQPQLAALELLVYPSSVELLLNEALTLAGTIEILPMQSPLSVFVWNPTRITPVRITSLDITEEAFDTNLNPIRARVALEMRVLNVNDTGFLNPAGALYMVYQIEKEALALANALQSLGTLAGSISL
ncbi:MAG: hypothetical protein ACREFH_18040 [Stellaceae bacterium]